VTTRTITYTEQLTALHCHCGIAFAIPDALHTQAYNNGKTFYCPLGHPIVYSETEAQRVTRKLVAEERRTASLLAQLDQVKASHSATKGQLTKARNRAARGVCQCCKRSFVDVARHMETQHPDFVEANR
jgi:hypothetical protein